MSIVAVTLAVPAGASAAAWVTPAPRSGTRVALVEAARAVLATA